jgi:FkbH-like protein
MTAHDQLLGVFKFVFPHVPAEELEAHRDWDSLKAIELIVEIERSFKTTVDLNRIMELASFHAILTYLSPTSPDKKKGIITDLDGTLWAGLIGESSARNTPSHVEYQEFLRKQMDHGLLVAVASKNDERHALGGVTMLAPALKAMHPFAARWEPKSQSVAEILRTWNIQAKDVVFVDDSEWEIAEVSGMFPDMTCVHYVESAETLDALKVLCERTGPVTYEDTIRMQSIRSGSEFKREADRQGADPEAYEEFLRRVHGKVTFHQGWSPRVQELVEKTNQFNLNGIRRTRRELEAPGTITFSVEYEDKFGPLGTIAVVNGWRSGGFFHVDTFAMSCRALGRMIEKHILVYLFDYHLVDDSPHVVRTIMFSHKSTPFNGPFATFLQEYDAGSSLRIYRRGFDPIVPHQHQV